MKHSNTETFIYYNDAIIYHMSHDCNDCIEALTYWNVLQKDDKVQDYALVSYFIGTELHVDVIDKTGFADGLWETVHQHGTDKG